MVKTFGPFDKNLKCPGCGAGADAATADSKKEPRDGDIAICFYCGQINRYKIDELGIKLVEVTKQDLDLIRRQDPETFWQIFRTVTSINATKKD